ncbi:MAG: hypothetical protein U0822_25130 [Anaerolineae bacterium]
MDSAEIGPDLTGAPGMSAEAPEMERGAVSDEVFARIPRGPVYTLVQALGWPAWLVAILVGCLSLVGICVVVYLRLGVTNFLAWLWDNQGIGVPIVTGITFFAAWYLDAAAETMLRQMRPAVGLSDAAYDALAMRALRSRRPATITYLILAILLGPVAWYGTTARHEVFVRDYILVGITVVAFLVLLAFDAGLRGMKSMKAVTRAPLDIDIFDTDDLTPIARLSLRITTAGLVIVVLLVFFWGISEAAIAPYLYTVFVVISALSFVMPLWHLHKRMATVRTRELETIQAMVRDAYSALKLAPDAERHKRAETLAYLIQTETRIASARTWPYDFQVLGQFAVILLIPLGVATFQVIINRL